VSPLSASSMLEPSMFYAVDFQVRPLSRIFNGASICALLWCMFISFHGLCAYAVSFFSHVVDRGGVALFLVFIFGTPGSQSPTKLFRAVFDLRSFRRRLEQGSADQRFINYTSKHGHRVVSVRHIFVFSRIQVPWRC